QGIFLVWFRRAGTTCVGAIRQNRLPLEINAVRGSSDERSSTGSSSDRHDRLAAELRANLRKRKARARSTRATAIPHSAQDRPSTRAKEGEEAACWVRAKGANRPCLWGVQPIIDRPNRRN